MFFGLLDPHPDLLDRDTDLKIQVRIRIHTKMSRIRNTDRKDEERVEAGADLNICNESGCFGTSLHYAIMKVNRNKKPVFSANHSCPGVITTVESLI
jgi:hypothetical protein